MGFGGRVAVLRDKKGWTQTELGEKIGTSKTMIIRYEKEQMTPSVTIAEKIAQAFGVTVDYLLSGDVPILAIGEAGSYDKYIRLLEGMSEEDKVHTLAVMEAFVIKAKLKPESNK